MASPGSIAVERPGQSAQTLLLDTWESPVKGHQDGEGAGAPFL